MDPATSQNPGWRGRPERAQDRFPLPPPLGEEDAIKTYSTLTTATGGIFAAVPGINSSDPAEETRYINIGTNIAVSATLPTVGLVVPGDGPRGTSIDVDITGSNTNFQSSSALSFAGSGITVNFRLVRSATSMTANITIDPSAATGFRDVTVTTNLGGGSVETAVGVGAFNVVQAPTMPTILSASPNSSGRGTTLDVTISGASTAFTAASVPIFCLSDFCADVSDHDPKIVVNSKTVNGPRSMRVNITIAADAEISYRSLSVITGRGGHGDRARPVPGHRAAALDSDPHVDHAVLGAARPDPQRLRRRREHRLRQRRLGAQLQRHRHHGQQHDRQLADDGDGQHHDCGRRRAGVP
jgi:hypothetical protein